MKLPAYILIALLIAAATWAIDLAASGHLDAGVSLTEGIVYPVNAEHSPAGGSEQTAANAPPRPNFLRMRVTAYCPGSCCCGEFADGITASGKPITANGGLIVAAPQSFAFDTIIDIPGYGRAVVLDRGGAIKGDRLDVLFATHSAALRWGVRLLDVTIIQ